MTSPVTGGWSHYWVLRGDKLHYLNVQFFGLMLHIPCLLSFFFLIERKENRNTKFQRYTTHMSSWGN